MIVITRIVFFHIKSHPIALRMDLFRSTSGSPPSSVPAGQISLQKYGAPCPMISTTNIGSRITNTTKITYFNLRSNLSPRNVRIFFGNGILFSRSNGAGPSCPGAGIAVQPRNTYIFQFSGINLSSHKSGNTAVGKKRPQCLDPVARPFIDFHFFIIQFQYTPYRY